MGNQRPHPEPGIAVVRDEAQAQRLAGADLEAPVRGNQIQWIAGHLEPEALGREGAQGIDYGKRDRRLSHVGKPRDPRDGARHGIDLHTRRRRCGEAEAHLLTVRLKGLRGVDVRESDTGLEERRRGEDRRLIEVCHLYDEGLAREGSLRIRCPHLHRVRADLARDGSPGDEAGGRLNLHAAGRAHQGVGDGVTVRIAGRNGVVVDVALEADGERLGRDEGRTVPRASSRRREGAAIGSGRDRTTRAHALDGVAVSATDLEAEIDENLARGLAHDGGRAAVHAAQHAVEGGVRNRGPREIGFFSLRPARQIGDGGRRLATRAPGDGDGAAGLRLFRAAPASVEGDYSVDVWRVVRGGEVSEDRARRLPYGRLGGTIDAAENSVAHGAGSGVPDEIDLAVLRAAYHARGRARPFGRADADLADRGFALARFGHREDAVGVGDQGSSLKIGVDEPGRLLQRDRRLPLGFALDPVGEGAGGGAPGQIDLPVLRAAGKARDGADRRGHRRRSTREEVAGRRNRQERYERQRRREPLHDFWPRIFRPSPRSPTPSSSAVPGSGTIDAASE